MIEEELRATFARHEELAPAVGPLRAAIDRIAARRRRRRLAVRTPGAALAVLAVVAVPMLGRTVARLSPRHRSTTCWRRRAVRSRRTAR